MQRSYAEMRRLHAQVVAVGQGTAQEVAAVCGQLGVEFPCVGDPRRLGYRAFGLPLGSWQQVVLGPEARQRGRDAAAKGFSINWQGLWMRHSNWWQLPGVAIIDRAGIIRFLYRARHSGDFPPTHLLLRELAGL